MQRRPFLMTLLTFSAIRSCQSRNNFHRACIRPALKNASRPKEAIRHRAPPSLGTHILLRGANVSSRMPAFQCHQYFSTNAATKISPMTTLWSIPHTRSDLITKWADPGQISPEKDYIMCFAGKTHSSGNSGSGMVLFDSDGSELWWGHQSLGDITSNEADYITLVTGLQCARSLGVQRITAQGCNDLLHRQMEGTFKVKKPSLKEYYEKAVSLSSEFASFQIRHVEKNLNKRAVELAKKAMAMQSTDLVEPDNATSLQDAEGSDKEKMSPSVSLNANVSLDPGMGKKSPSISPNSDVTLDGSISPGKTYVLRFDGGSRGNPGLSGAGMVLYDSEDGSELWSGYQYLGEKNTNNEAEYMGLITGLQCARSLGVENIVVQGDSQLILRQVDGKYKVNSPNLKSYHKEALSLSKEFESFQTSHIERARNGRADELANKAMDNKCSKGFDTS